MLPLFCLILVVSSGSLIGTVFYKKRFEEVLPLTTSFIVLILFFFGIINQLLFGFYFVTFLIFLAYAISIFAILKKKFIEKKSLSYSLYFTPGFFFFVFLILFIAFCERGKVLYGNDEFSHWGYIVKIMVFNDDFGTNPAYNAIFKSYPPGMAIFQYFYQKLNWILTGEKFVESYLYISYFTFYFSFLIPFLKRIKFKNIFISLVSAVIIFLFPILLFPEIYSQITIDPFLGMLSSVGLAYIFLSKERDALFSLSILCISSVLVITKDAGLFFAIILAVAYVADSTMNYRNNKKKGKLIFDYIFASSAVVVPKLLWKYDIYINDAGVSFSGKIDILDLFTVIIRRNPTYRQDVWEDFFMLFLRKGIELGNTGVVITYFVFAIILFALIYYLSKHIEEEYVIPSWRRRLFFGALLIETTIYMVGIVVSYMYKFSEYEATILASFDRYTRVMYLGLWLTVTLLSIYVLNKKSKKTKLNAIIALVCMLMVTPLDTVYEFILKEHVTVSNIYRSYYQPLCDKINATEENSRVRIISQGDDGYPKLAINFVSYPHCEDDYWSIGEPFFDGDIWTVPMEPEEFWESLYSKYDYLAIYNINDYFVETYGHLFEKGTEITGGSLYRVNKEKMVLEKVG